MWQIHFRARISPCLILLSSWALGAAPRVLQSLELFTFEAIWDNNESTHTHILKSISKDSAEELRKISVILAGTDLQKLGVW